MGICAPFPVHSQMISSEPALPPYTVRQTANPVLTEMDIGRLQLSIFLKRMQ